MAARRQGRYRVAGIDVDPRRRRCVLDGTEVPLRTQEFDLLEYLVRNPHRAIPEAELKAGILPEDENGSIPLEEYLERLGKLLELASGGEKLLIAGEDGTQTLEAEVIFEPEIWADTAETAVEEVAPGYAPYLSIDEDPEVVEGRRQLTPQERARLRRMAVVVLAVLVAGAGGWAIWSWMNRPQPTGVKAILSPMQDQTGQMGAALDAAVRLELEQSPFVSVATASQVSAALRGGKAGLQQGRLTDALARRACRERGDDLYVSGNLRRVGRNLVLTLEARNCGTNEQRAHSAGIASDATGVVNVLPQVVGDLRRQLGESRASVKRTSQALGRPGEAIVEALKDYTEAQRQAAAGQTNAAIVTMQKSLDVDKSFALAQLALSQLYADARQPELASASLRQAFDARNSLLPNLAMQVQTEYAERVSEDLNAALQDAKAWGAVYRLDARPQKAQARIEQQLGQPVASLEPAWKALELDDEDAGVYALLASGQLQAGRQNEALGTIRLATTHGLQDERLHWIAFEIAVERDDEKAMQAERAWAATVPTHMAQMRMLDAQREFALGEVRDAEADVEAAAELWRNQGMVGEADRHLAAAAWTEAKLGLTATAATTMKDLPEMVDSAPMALAWAQGGELEKTTTEMQQGLAAHPVGTLWQQVWAPEIGAAIALAEDKPEAAVETLRKAVGYEPCSPDIWLLRARAYLAEKQPELAEMEFRKLLAHPDLDPLSVDTSLAQLGLARALAAEGREAEAATELLMLQRSTWKSADKDLPALHAAQDELAKLSAAARAAAQAATPANSAATQATAPLRLPKPTSPR
jgi:tetratricopeptide (TPR) repeat protein